MAWGSGTGFGWELVWGERGLKGFALSRQRGESHIQNSVSGSTFQFGPSPTLCYTNGSQGLYNWWLPNSLAVILMSGLGVLCSCFSSLCPASPKPLTKSRVENDLPPRDVG